MSIKVQCSLAITLILCASIAQAKTATEVFEKVSPSVVVIRVYDAKGKNTMLGSGVVWEDGVVVTNCHVVKEAVTMQVERHEQKYLATLLQSDWDRDICSLAVDGLKGQAVTRGSTSRLKVGDKVYAVGAPQGLELTLSDGLISSLRPVAGGQYLQITAPISPGSSGGGLVDDEGRLIGLPTFYLTEGQQLNFAVPVEWVNELQAKQNGPAVKSKKTTVAAPKIKKTTTIEWVNKTQVFQKKKDWPGLVKYSLRWTKAQPENPDSWFILGFAYEKSKQTVKAIEAYRQALHINSEYANVWFCLGGAYDESNELFKAIEAYQQAIRINPDFAEAWDNLGNAYRKSNQLSKAIAAHQQAIRINPEDWFAWFNIGIAYGKDTQSAKAIEAYQQAIRINPDFAEAWEHLGKVYALSNQTAQAIEAYQTAIRINPEDAEAWFGLGITYGQSAQPSEAIDAYQHVIRINPEDAGAWHMLGAMYFGTGQNSKAIEASQRAVRIDPEKKMAWLNLGFAYDLSGQTGQVMEVYKRLKTLDPVLAEEFFSKYVLPR